MDCRAHGKRGTVAGIQTSDSRLPEIPDGGFSPFVYLKQMKAADHTRYCLNAAYSFCLLYDIADTAV